MTRQLLTRLVLLTAVLATLVAGHPFAASAAEGPVRKVLVLSLPRLTWADLAEGTPPVLEGLLARSAVGSLSPRTIGPTTSLGEGYASIGAGNRATVVSSRSQQLQPWLADGEAGFAFGADETFSGDPAGEVFARRTGVPSGLAPVVHIGMPAIAHANRRLLYGTTPGALGAALAGAGRSGAVVGNADLGEVAADQPVPQRELALALVDTDGRVGGRVDAGLVRAAPERPFGRAIDPAAYIGAFDGAWDAHDVVLVEASDLERADAFRLVADRQAIVAGRRAALRDFDSVIDHMLDRVDLARDLVIVVSPAPPRGATQLTVAAMAGAGVEPGALRSATTRRNGYITLPDIGPTILRAFGITIPGEMTGAIMSSGGGEGYGPRRVDSLIDNNVRATYRDRVTGMVTAVFIIFQLLVYALAAIAFSRHRRSLLRIAGTLSLMVLAFPPVAFLSGLVPYHRVSPPVYLALLFAGAGALAALARLAGGGDAQGPPLVLLAFSLALLLGDVASGGRLQLNTVFGYSPIVAGRFAGFGNLASAMVTVTALLVATTIWGIAKRRSAVGGRGPRQALLAGGLVLVFALVITGMPSLGSDVGGVLTDIPAFVIVVLLLAGVRIGWRRAVAIGALTLVALGAFAAIDLARPPEVRTHLGRLVSRTLSGGGGLPTTIERKAMANLSILTSSIWTYAIPVALAFLAFLVWRPQGFLRGVIERFPGARAGLIGSLVGGVLGFALNDSGVAIPAMMLGVLLPYLAWLVARTSPPVAPGARTPAGTSHEVGT